MRIRSDAHGCAIWRRIPAFVFRKVAKLDVGANRPVELWRVQKLDYQKRGAVLVNGSGRFAKRTGPYCFMFRKTRQAASHIVKAGGISIRSIKLDTYLEDNNLGSSGTLETRY